MMIEAGRVEGKLMGSLLISVPVPEKQAQAHSPHPTHLPHLKRRLATSVASHLYGFTLLEISGMTTHVDSI